MLKMSKLTDYGTLVLARLGSSGTLQSAAELAADTQLPLPTVSKLLKKLTTAGLVRSTRGANGGYKIDRPTTEISAVDVLDALEGPVAITECAQSDSHCRLESVCSVGTSWQHINQAIRHALSEISLADLTDSDPNAHPFTGFSETVVEFSGLQRP